MSDMTILGKRNPQVQVRIFQSFKQDIKIISSTTCNLESVVVQGKIVVSILCLNVCNNCIPMKNVLLVDLENL